MKIYDFEDGFLDSFLDGIVGSTSRAKKELSLRGEVIIVKGKCVQNLESATLNAQNGFVQSGAQGSFRTYLYLSKYYAKNGFPKRHYFNCEAVKTYSSFVSANSDAVTLTCRDNGQKHSDITLITCEHCRDIFRKKTAMELYGKSFHEFILDMEENEETKEKRLGVNGYTINWRDISTAYRTIHNFTCEKCSICIEGKQDRHYLHVHHINRDKKDNRRANLQCLCIECHSNVDELHRRNFSTLEQQRLLRKFRKKFR